MTARRRVLFIGEAVTLAHVVRPLALARGLDPTRYACCFACDARFDHLFGEVAFERRPLRSVSTAQFAAALAKGAPLYRAETLESYVEEDLALLRSWRPDVVVGDFRLSLSVSARLANVPYVTITNAYWSPFARQDYVVPDLPFTRVLGATLGQWLFDAVRPAAFALHTKPLDRVRRRHGLAPLGMDLRRTYTDADRTLYADLPEIVPLQDSPATHRYIGPVLWSPAAPSPAWWNELPRDRPNVYVTMGSSGRKDLLPAILRALSTLEVNVLAATAGAPVPTDLPSNAYVAPYLPGIETARRAAVVVCNGGSPTSYQGLAAGAPVIGLASNLDQYLNMRYFERAGAGRLLRAEGDAGLRVREVVASALRSGAPIRTAAAALGARARELDGVEQFASFLDEFVGAGRVPDARPQT